MDKYKIVTNKRGYTYRFLNNNYHREDGPAIVIAGDELWYINGVIHRDGGPAVMQCEHKNEWYLNGELHREDGPAIEYYNGDKFWYLNDQRLSEEQYRRRAGDDGK